MTVNSQVLYQEFYEQLSSSVECTLDMQDLLVSHNSSWLQTRWCHLPHTT